jgi:excisionase family DNA binding protein
MNEKPIEDRILLRMAEAATVLGLGRSTVYQLVRQGELPFVKVGRAIRIPAQALDTWVDGKTSVYKSSVPPWDTDAPSESVGP